MLKTQDAVQLLDRQIRSRYPVIEVVTHEEPRVMAFLSAIAQQRKRNMIVQWSAVKGFTFMQLATDGWVETDKWTITSSREIVDGSKFKDAAGALEFIVKFPHDNKAPTLFVLKDLHPYMNQPKIVRALREISFQLTDTFSTLLMINPYMAVPADLEKNISVIDFPLPDQDELAEILKRAETNLPKSVRVRLAADSRERLVQALSGLTALEAGRAILLATNATGELSENTIPHIIAEKKQIILKSSLEAWEPVSVSELGGMDLLKEDMQMIAASYSADARKAGIDRPRGVLLVGPPGTGKTLAAKVIASTFKVMLLRCDVGALKGGIVGQTEANTRNVLKIAEAAAPCVLLFDEGEKGLGRPKSGELDGNTSSNMYATILTWFQETTAPVYVVMTVNNFNALDTALVRRFDDVYNIGLPNAGDRVKTLKIHLRKRGHDIDQVLPAGDERTDVVNSLWQFSGAEIEKVVKTALRLAFREKRTVGAGDLLKAAEIVVPVSRMDGKDISAIALQAGGKVEEIDPRLMAKGGTMTLELDEN